MSAQKTENKITRYNIWTSEPDFDQWKENMASEYPDESEDTLRAIMYETNNIYLDDEKLNLGHLIPENGILAIAQLGLWHGTKQAVLEKNIPESVSDCLRSYVSGDSEITFYVDLKGEFRAEEIHHDGRNTYCFRAWKPDVTEKQKAYLLLKIYMGLDAESGIKRLTYRLGDQIGDVYGWKFPHRPKCSIPVDTKEV